MRRTRTDPTSTRTLARPRSSASLPSLCSGSLISVWLPSRSQNSFELRLSLATAPILNVFSLRTAPRHANVSCEVHQLSLGAHSSTPRLSDSLRLLGLPARSQLGPSFSAPSQLAWIHICRATAIRTSCQRSLNLPFFFLLIPFAHVYLVSRAISCPLAQRHSSP